MPIENPLKRHLLFGLTLLAMLVSARVGRQYTCAQNAKEMIYRVQTYWVLHRQYPESLRELGLSGQDRNTLGGVSYTSSPPWLAYPGIIPFSMHIYDFGKGAWEYRNNWCCRPLA
jgi:hypothetical protein